MMLVPVSLKTWKMFVPVLEYVCTKVDLKICEMFVPGLKNDCTQVKLMIWKMFVQSVAGKSLLWTFKCLQASGIIIVIEDVCKSR